MIKRRLLMPAKFGKLHSLYKDRAFTVLDVGCGDNSPSLTKAFFPRATYHGLDRVDYNIDEADRASIDKLYRMDLDTDSLDVIPDGSFDLIIMAHVIEHLRKPEEVVRALCAKLKTGGHFYLEFPTIRTLGLPSMEGTLQFCDDPTHIYLPNPYDIANALLQSDMRILDGRVRREPIRAATAPLFHARNLARRLRGKRPHSRGLWDAKGFAFYMLSVRK